MTHILPPSRHVQGVGASGSSWQAGVRVPDHFSERDWACLVLFRRSIPHVQAAGDELTEALLVSEGVT